MEKDKEEKLNQKKSNEMFNSITEKVKPENQNQTHNSQRAWDPTRSAGPADPAA